MSSATFTIAAVQAEPVFLDPEGSIGKACRLIAEAAEKGAKLIVFPEAFIAGYPDWIWQVPPGNMALNQSLYARFLDAAVALPSPEVKSLCDAAAAAHVYLAIGINERSASGGSVYNTLLFIGPEGRVLGHHQKLVPTLAERTVWAFGDPATLEVYDTPMGRLGGLICWENYMPLVRQSLYERGIALYAAPTYDEGSAWQASMRHIGKEGRVYIAGCCMILRKQSVLDALPELEPYYRESGEWINSGNSMIAGPNGEVLAEPLYQKEGILYAEIDPMRQKGAKWNLDVAGHYARPDAFRLERDFLKGVTPERGE
ncbi:carbon-nitrogen hydrolase family protein [Sulfurimonas sp. HSL-3221]|uniref:carbon-nitrogen hydrolase family protein n=1 Tax=Sulfurimonadaceae TaxID=2771471 RepID=UPI001E29A352|nr:carbon-nitrogen hydrolase family protein [Sulfurimonas sp. HSL-3221]UFS62121.1 carbon-nitrogen hydrolase family protein [Sulfurimonas sp. HSL-3221]